jgi:hypothetical protein
VKCTEIITWMVRQAHKICTKLILDVSEFFPKKVYYAESTRQLNWGRTKQRHGTEAIRVLARSAGWPRSEWPFSCQAVTA